MLASSYANTQQIRTPIGVPQNIVMENVAKFTEKHLPWSSLLLELLLFSCQSQELLQNFAAEHKSVFDAKRLWWILLAKIVNGFYPLTIFSRRLHHACFFVLACLFFFFFVWVFFHEHSRITGLQGKRVGVSLTPLYHLHPLHRHLDISRGITVESSSLHTTRSQNRTRNLWLARNTSKTLFAE